MKSAVCSLALPYCAGTVPIPSPPAHTAEFPQAPLLSPSLSLPLQVPVPGQGSHDMAWRPRTTATTGHSQRLSGLNHITDRVPASPAQWSSRAPAPTHTTFTFTHTHTHTLPVTHCQSTSTRSHSLPSPSPVTYKVCRRAKGSTSPGQGTPAAVISFLVPGTEGQSNSVARVATAPLVSVAPRRCQGWVRLTDFDSLPWLRPSLLRAT